MADERCIDCAHFHRGYRLQGMRVPDFCNRHFHSQHADDPACNEFKPAAQEDTPNDR